MKRRDGWNQQDDGVMDHKKVRNQRIWAAALLLTLAACAQPSAPQQTGATGPDYDGVGRSWTWQGQGGSLQAASIDAGDNTLSFEPFVAATNGWGPPERDRSNGETGAADGHPLNLRGRIYARGFGVHANSSLSFALLGRCQRFTVDLGIDDEVRGRGSTTFQVYGDGVQLFDSGVLTGKDATRSINVDIAGRQQLRLVVTDGGDGLDYDHADWANATLRGCGAAPIPPPAPPTVPPTPPQPPTPDTGTTLRLNAGGPAQSVDGALWSGCPARDACQGWVQGGFAYAEPDAAIAGVSVPANADLYRSEWTGGASQGVPAGASAFSLHFPIRNGKYQVRLHFAELNKPAPGLRIFDVKLENVTVLQNFDIFREAGGLDRAIVRSFEVDVQDGAVDLDFIRRVENAKLSALEILPLAAGPVPMPPPPHAPLSWAARAPAPTTLYEGQGAGVGGRLYVFGGFDKNVNYIPIATRAANVYDPAADRWIRLRDIPDLVTHAGVAVDGQSIYLAGGFLGNHPGPQTDHVWRYDVGSDTWSALPGLPVARGAGALVRLGRELHYFGGVDRDARGRYLSDHGDHWVLNLDGASPSSTGSWRTAAPMPNPRNHLAGAAINGLIYAIGGQHLGDEANGDQSEMDVYDAATDTWRMVSPLPIPLGHITSSVFGWRGQIIVAGGVTLGERESAQVFAYDPATNRWSILPALPGSRQSPVADVVGEALVVATGATAAGPTDSTFVSR